MLMINYELNLDGQKHGHCKRLENTAKDVRGVSDNWNGNEWNVALKANEYGITDIESCMTVACSPYVDCVGVSWHNTPYCYVWDNCDFDNLIEDIEYVSLKKDCEFALNMNRYLDKIELIDLKLEFISCM